MIITLTLEAPPITITSVVTVYRGKVILYTMPTVVTVQGTPKQTFVVVTAETILYTKKPSEKAPEAKEEEELKERLKKLAASV